MDYLEIIRKGYFDETEKANLSDYLLEQYYKAESKTMTLKRFFDGCFNTIEALNKDIETKIIKRKEELINWAENSDNNKDHYIGELKAINIDNFTTTLPQGGQLRAKDIDFIKEAIQAAKVKATEPNTGQPQQDNSKMEITIDMIAMKYVYEGLRITRENGNEIAKQYGYNSGEKLFQRFTYFSSTANRKGIPTPCTPKRLKNKIEKIEKVISLLPKNKQQKALDEVSILKNTLESEYQ